MVGQAVDPNGYELPDLIWLVDPIFAMSEPEPCQQRQQAPRPREVDLGWAPGRREKPVRQEFHETTPPWVIALVDVVPARAHS